MSAGETVTFGAVGDIGFRQGVHAGVQAHGHAWPFELMKKQLSEADVLFGNFETVLAPPGHAWEEFDPRGLIAHFYAPDCAKALAAAGFKVMNLASNHVLDAGEAGLFYTKETLEAAGLATAGAGVDQAAARKPLILESHGLTFGFLCYGEDSNYSLGKTGPSYAYFELVDALADIEKVRPEVDILVVSVHADLEFMPTPSLPRLEAFRRLARAGADIVLGHHPHVPQGCEMVDGCLIVYSLGNFVFPAHSSPYNAAHLPETAYSYLLLCDVGKDGVIGFRRTPVIIQPPPDERPAPASGLEKDRIARHLVTLDSWLLDEDLLAKNWQEAARQKFMNYFSLVLGHHSPELPRWKHAVARIFGIPIASKSVTPDMEFFLEDLVGRLCLTAENRQWMLEILAMARQNWHRRNSNPGDPLHRPHYALSRRFYSRHG